MDLVLIGIQGSGKGTQAKLVAEKYGMKVFETGAVLREMAKKKNSLGKKINSIISIGKLVPPGVIINILNQFLNETHEGQGIIFDGIPRSLIQKKLFDKILHERKRDFIVMELQVDKKKTFERLLKRATIENRNDDNEIIIKNRFENFHKFTQPVVEAYRKEKHLISINGEQAIDDVKKEAFDKLQNLL